MRPERTATAWISCALWVPNSDLVFPSIIRSICLCREIKKCAVWQTSDKGLETDGFCVRDAAQSFLGLGRERRCCTAHRTREVHSVIQTTPFIRTRSFLVLESIRVPVQEKHHLSFSNPCVCQISNTNTIHLCDVFEVTAPPRCTPCTTLPSQGDAVSLSCLSVSFLAATATEKILSLCIHQRFLEL